MILLLACNTQNQNSSANLEKINIKTNIANKNIVSNKINTKYSNDYFFKILFDYIIDFYTNIELKIDNKIKIAGFKPSKSNKKATLSFSNIQNYNNDNVFHEEFFHAFQFAYYLKTRKITNITDFYNISSNIEFEAKLYKACISILSDKPVGETPSQKGLINLAINVIESESFDIFFFEKHHKTEYNKCLHHFQKHWKKRDKNEFIESLYSNTLDSNLLPEASLYIINKYKTQNHVY